MKFLTEYMRFHTKKHRAYIHITPQVERLVEKSGVQEGMVLVSAMHITAGVYVNDNESGLIEDIDEWLERLAPTNPNYRHHQTGEDNGDSHLKSLLIHHEVDCAGHSGKARPRSLATHLLRRIRRPARQASDREGHGRVVYEDLPAFTEFLLCFRGT
jgi:secondary thiamine-phosphate synthase enzyme